MRKEFGSTALQPRIMLSVVAVVLLSSCTARPEEDPTMSDAPPLVRLLAQGDAVFGMFSGAKTPEQGGVMVQNRAIDFVFYSLESGPFDIPTMQAYMRGMEAGAGTNAVHPVALRIPPIRDGADSARSRTQQGLRANVASIVFPHVMNGEEAAIAVASMGSGSWPANSEGTTINMLLIEDQEGIANAREIVSTPGVSVVFPGPGDLRRAYDRDSVAVETAIQTVLAACKEFDVPCGITAGVDDIAVRITQGFRVIIVSDPEALVVGRAAAGRDGES